MNDIFYIHGGNKLISANATVIHFSFNEFNDNSVYNGWYRVSRVQRDAKNIDNSIVEMVNVISGRMFSLAKFDLEVLNHNEIEVFIRA